MLTPSNIRNIRNFHNLNKNHQRVFRHRIRKKFDKCVDDIEYIFLNKQTLRIKLDDVIDEDKLMKLLKLLEDYRKLQNM